ncbi:MAG: hypothetical protein ACO1NO_11665 [Burkholderiaceae bacterium]
MSLHQLQLSYQSEQDRLLFRVSFTESAQELTEARAWMTRRLVGKLWEGIVRAMETQVGLEKPLAVQAKAEMVEMAYQDSVDKAKQAGSFNQAFQDGIHDQILGEEPILVTTVHIGVHANRPLTINFCPSKGYGFEIAFTPQILHGFCALMQQVVKTAEWGLELKLPESAVSADRPRILN